MEIEPSVKYGFIWHMVKADRELSKDLDTAKCPQLETPEMKFSIKYWVK